MVRIVFLLVLLASSQVYAKELVVEPPFDGTRYNTYHIHDDGTLVSSQQTVPTGVICECEKGHWMLKGKLPILSKGRQYCTFKDGGALLASCVPSSK
jgi:hypothetical protein